MSSSSLSYLLLDEYKPLLNARANDFTIDQNLSVAGTSNLNLVNISGDINSTSNASFIDLTCQDINVSTNCIVGSSLQTPAIKVTTTPTNGYVLTSDASGNGSWQAVPSAPASQVIISPFVVDGSGSPAVGSYPTIQSAVNATNTAPYLGVEQTIFVKSFGGGYNEIVTIPANSMHLNIVGVGSGLDNSGPNIRGGFVNHFSSTLTLSNLALIGDGVHVSFDIGDLVESPSLNLINCIVSNPLDIFSIGQNSYIVINDCHSLNSSAVCLHSNVSSDNSQITINNCPFLFGSTSAIDLDGGASNVTVNINDSLLESTNDIVIKTNNGIILTIQYCDLVNTTYEDVSLSATSTLSSKYNAYSSSAVSTYVIVGTGTLNYFSDHAEGLNVLYDIGLTKTAYTALS